MSPPPESSSRAGGLWPLLCLALIACGSRSPLPDLDVHDAAVAVGGDAVPPPTPPPLPGCFDAGETLLKTDEAHPTAIAIDATHVYWASTGSDCSDGSIRRIAKAGGAVETLAKNQPSPRAIAVDATRVYFYNGCGTGLLRSVPIAGGPVVDHPIAVDAFNDARVIALDGANIYFNDYGVLSAPKSGGPQTVIDNQNYVYGLAADDQGVHWIGPIGGGPTFGVFAYQAGDPTATLLAQPSDVGSGIALDQKFVYFVGGAGILRIPRAGGALDTIAAGDPWRVAVDETSVYYSEGYLGSSGHSIKKVDKTGGTETVLSTGSGAYVDLAVDERCVYWSDLYGNAIGRVPK